MISVLLALVATAAQLTAAPPTPAAPWLDGLPHGDRPAVGYVADGTWHGPAGRRLGIPDRHGISAITPYAGGFLVTDTRFFEGSVGLARVDARGRTVASWSTSGVPAVAADGRVAWSSLVPPETGLGGRSLVHVDDCSLAWPERAGVFSVAGFSGDEVVVSDYLGTYLLSPSGERSRVPHLVFAYDATGRWVAGQHGLRSAVVDLRTGDVRWRAPGDGLTFSPSGRRVAAVHRDRVVVRRTGDGRVLWESAFRGYAGPLVWEGTDVLAVVAHRDRAAILRFTPTLVERTTPVRAYHFQRPAYVLAGG